MNEVCVEAPLMSKDYIGRPEAVADASYSYLMTAQSTMKFAAQPQIASSENCDQNCGNGELHVLGCVCQKLTKEERFIEARHVDLTVCGVVRRDPALFSFDAV